MGVYGVCSKNLTLVYHREVSVQKHVKLGWPRRSLKCQQLLHQVKQFVVEKFIIFDEVTGV